MTDKEKLKKALEALRFIGEGKLPNIGQDEVYAAQVYAELTAPMMVTVEIKYYATVITECNGVSAHYTDKESAENDRADNEVVVELTGTYSRPIEEKEEVWEGILTTDERGKPYVLFKDTPTSNYNGKTVEVRLKGE